MEDLEKWKVYSSFKDNIWGTDLKYMQLISKYNKEIWLLLFFIFSVNMYRLFFWKTKKSITITHTFQKALDGSEGQKQHKLWIDKDNELCKRWMKSWLQVNNLEIYLIYNVVVDENR